MTPSTLTFVTTLVWIATLSATGVLGHAGEHGASLAPNHSHLRASDDHSHGHGHGHGHASSPHSHDALDSDHHHHHDKANNHGHEHGHEHGGQDEDRRLSLSDVVAFATAQYSRMTEAEKQAFQANIPKSMPPSLKTTTAPTAHAS